MVPPPPPPQDSSATAPVKDTNIANYGKERILARASEIDVFLAQSGTMNQPTLDLIKAESGFQAMYDYTRPKTIWVNTSSEPIANPFVMR